ncbi:hypothetical protein [Nocardia terpenica]|uniref:hypothetical protein n=1 Tax=Nocardia terpenica TaxID=455432 RepID=UPI0012FDF62B|nr:hypothetical protein [Nocardia terpenica]
MTEGQPMTTPQPLTPNQRVGVLLGRVAGWVFVALAALCLFIASRAGDNKCLVPDPSGFGCSVRHDPSQMPLILAGVFLVVGIGTFFVVKLVRRTLATPA